MFYKSSSGLFFIMSEVKVAQSCLILCDPMDYTVHGIIQARILEWATIPFSRNLPNPGIKPRSSALQEDSLPVEPQESPRILESVAYPFSRGSAQPRDQTGVYCIAGRFFISCANLDQLWIKSKVELCILFSRHS